MIEISMTLKCDKCGRIGRRAVKDDFSLEHEFQVEAFMMPESMGWFHIKEGEIKGLYCSKHELVHIFNGSSPLGTPTIVYKVRQECPIEEQEIGDDQCQ